MRYRVTIYYCEPLYAQSRGIPLKEQRGTFEVDAHSEGQATSMAVEAFKEVIGRLAPGDRAGRYQPTIRCHRGW